MLTDSAIKRLKPPPPEQTAPDKHSDALGLQLHIFATGRMSWIYAYRHDGKQRTLTIGKYPSVSLADARRKRDGARQQIQQGIDPNQTKQQAKRTEECLDTFAHIAHQWLSDQADAVKPITQTRSRRMLENDLIPMIGDKPIRSLKASDILAAAKKVEDRGAAEVARRVIRLAGSVLRYAIRHDLADNDPTPRLGEALKPRKVENMARVSKKTPIRDKPRRFFAA